MEKILVSFMGALEVAVGGVPTDAAGLSALLSPVKHALNQLGAALEMGAPLPGHGERWDNGAARHVVREGAALVFAELSARIPVEGGKDALLNAGQMRDQVKEQLEQGLLAVCAPLFRAGLQAQTSVQFQLDEEDERILSRRDKFVNRGAVTIREDAAYVKAQERLADQCEDADACQSKRVFIPIRFERI